MGEQTDLILEGQDAIDQQDAMFPDEPALEDLLIDIIEQRIFSHERTQQKRIGPSGLGTPCLRKLGFRLAEVPSWREQDAAWRPTVGTAVHSWLHEAFNDLNDRELASELHSANGRCKAPWCHAGVRAPHTPRFATELRAVCGTLPVFDGEGKKVQEIPGTLDVFDRLTGTLVDWKVCGPGKLKDYRSLVNRDECPSAEYRTQGHVYGRGLAHTGVEVRTIAIMFLPMNGELRDALWWEEPYDPEVGKEAFNRARRLIGKFNAEGAEEVIPRLKRAPDNCGHCPWFNPGAEGDDLAVSCPGSQQMRSASPSDMMTDLLGSD